ncbi:MAG TPA: hypothetical protein PKC87_03235 [Candidatus Absconditabacterales bacterium]|nr:hypothetical protein [Candidatus Absconditabacterales bacterium]
MNEHVYTNALKEFIPLVLEEKKGKLIKLIANFRNTHPIFGEITQDIQTLDYTDKQYIDIYKIVLKSMYDVEKEGLEIGIERIEKLHKFLMQLKAKESEENKKEGDIDIWLDKVLSTLQ